MTSQAIIKKQLLNGEPLQFNNDNEDLINVWFQPKTNNFCLELNARVIKATKTLKPIIHKLCELNVKF